MVRKVTHLCPGVYNTAVTYNKYLRLYVCTLTRMVRIAIQIQGPTENGHIQYLTTIIAFGRVHTYVRTGRKLFEGTPNVEERGGSVADGDV